MTSSLVPGALRVVSWNLLRRVGAGVEDVARLVKSRHPDLLLLQECTEDIAALPSLVGGHFFRPVDEDPYLYRHPSLALPCLGRHA
jgi:hypothetical protein